MITARAHYVRHQKGTRVLIDIVLVDGTAHAESSPVGFPVEHLQARNGYDLTPEQASSASIGEQLHRLGAKASEQQAAHMPAAEGFDYDGKQVIAPALTEIGAGRALPPREA